MKYLTEIEKGFEGRVETELERVEFAYECCVIHIVFLRFLFHLSLVKPLSFPGFNVNVNNFVFRI